MEKDIVNRVANSALMTIDLEDHYPEGERTLIDIRPWLFQELILRESDFRNQLKAHDWKQYEGHYVAITCSADAIIPSWAYLLIGTHLAPYARLVVVGSLNTLEHAIFREVIRDFPIEDYKDKPVVVTGCSKRSIPESAYVDLVTRLTGVARSVMFGEACSTVPLFKRPVK
jgi:hypothetical protein